jgi:lipopolysaccharide/colanic/teichoic acid biosynthesis glycosyltransferase
MRALGWLMLIVAAPVIGLLLVVVRLTSPGPGVYSQLRLGRGGRVFTMYKLRSMRADAEERTGPVWASLRRDPRVTPLGHWLRLLHLDELPQLYNVARGDMALVGPRPERPSIAAVLAEKIPGYLDRLQVLPGITGLAQVNLPADSDLSSVRAKLQLDQEYIHTASLLLDLRIILCTLLRLIGMRGGRAVSLLGLKRAVVLPPAEGPQDVVPVAPSSPAYTSIEVRVGPDFAPVAPATEALSAPEPATAGPA